MYGQLPPRAASPAAGTHLQRSAPRRNRATADAARSFYEFEEATQGQFFFQWDSTGSPGKASLSRYLSGKQQPSYETELAICREYLRPEEAARFGLIDGGDLPPFSTEAPIQ